MLTNTKTPLEKCIIVYNDPNSSSSHSSLESQSIALSRVIPSEVLEWVYQGWIPLEEQELFQSLLVEGDFQSFLMLNRKRCQNEINSYTNKKDDKPLEIEENHEPIPFQASQVPMKITGIKRPVQQSNEDELIIEDFFDELKEGEKCEMVCEPSVIPSKRRKVKDVEQDPIQEKEVYSPSEENTHSIITEEEPLSTVVSTKCKGKNFVKKQVKTSSRIIKLKPYLG